MATPTLKTSGRSGNTNTATTASVATTSGVLQALAIATTPNTGSSPDLTISGWTLVHQRNFNAGDLERSVYLYQRLGTGGSISATINTTDASAFKEIRWSWIEWADVVEFLQPTSAIGNSSTPSVTLGAFGDAAHGTLEIIGSASGLDPTVGTGFTQLHEVAGSVQGDYLTVGWRSDNDTSVDASSSSGSDFWGIIGVELSETAAGVTVSVPAGALTMAGLAPTALTPRLVSVPVGGLTLSGFEPNVLTPRSVPVPSAGLTVSGFAPEVLSSAHVAVVVPLGDVTLTGFAPSVVSSQSVLISVTQGQVLLTGYSPTVIGETISSRKAGYATRRNYIFKGKRYFQVTFDELTRLIAEELEPVTREEIKVVHRNKKPHKIARDAFESLMDTVSRIPSQPKAHESEDDEDIDDILALL